MWKLILFVCLFVHCALSVRIKSTRTPVAVIADSPVYDGPRRSIFYVDYGVESNKPCLFRYNVIKKRTYSAYIKGPSLGSPGFIIPNKGGKTFTVGFKDFVGIVCWDGKSDCATLEKELYRGGPGITPDLGPNERIYVGHRDLTGRALHAGTISLAYCGVPANQSVHVKRKGAQQERVLTGLTLPIGYAYTKGCVYILDACQLKLWAIPDEDSKYRWHRRHTSDEPYVVIDFTEDGKNNGNFFPAGLEADKRGIIYTGDYYTGCIYAINPKKGTYWKVAQLPVKGCSALSFGEDNGRGQNLYVSVASNIRNVETGQIIETDSPESALYVCKGLGEGVEFKRYRAC